jgi:hypothetical protein
MSEISGESASKLKETDQAILNVEFEGSDTCLIKGEVAEVLKKFVLSNRGVDDVYNYRIIKGIDEVQRRFLGRLNSILTMPDEKYVDNFINTFLTDGGFDDGEQFECSPGNLVLKVYNRISAQPDRECKLITGRKSQILWLIVENKTKDDVGSSRLQLAACMIAAMQHNYEQNKENKEDIMGMLVVRNTFYFYRAIYNEEYLKALKDNNQCSALPLIVQELSHRISLKRSRSSQVRWKQVSLDILLPNEREDILKYMSYIWYKGKEILQKHLEHEGDD